MLGLLATTFLFLTEELLHCINMIIISQQDRSANCRYSYWCMIRHVCILFIKIKLATYLWSCWQTQLKGKFFFYQNFLSRTPTTHRTVGERRGPSFIPLYHLKPLTNIQTFILQLCTWDDFHIFLNAPLVFTRLLLGEIYHLIIEVLFDWLMMWCWFLFVYLLIWFKVFVIAIWHWKPVDSNSHQLSSLYYKRTD